MKWTQAYFALSLITDGVYSDTTVTIYPQWLAQGGRVRYESDRWNKHNGLEQESLIANCRSIRTDSGRWMNRDLNDRLFQDWPEDAHRSGYPDPNYLKNISKQQELFSNYLADIDSGYKNEMIMVMNALNWPDWMNQSEHEGQFPNNIDAAAEFIVLMLQGVYDYTQGHIPPYFEVVNEPDVKEQIMNFTTTVALFHKTVAEKLHSRFHIKVTGPTMTGYNTVVDRNDFSFWTKLVDFMDITLGYLDVFSFHSYNSLIVSGKSHRFTGINEARLVAFVDLLENYVHQKTGRIIPLIISEYGRGKVTGISSTAPSGIVDFATIYQSNAHRFTHLGLREYIDKTVVFLLSNQQYPGHDSLNRSLFTRQGNATRIVDVFKFWYNFTSEYSFIRTASQCDVQERTVSPLAMSSSLHNETVILLHSYSQQSQDVKLVFQEDWITPTTGEATCITLKDNWYPVITFNEPLDIGDTRGMVTLPPEATCRYTFKTPSSQLPKVILNETTYYGSDIIIPIKDSIAVTTILLPKDEFDSARLRVSTSLPINETNSLSSVTFNHQPLYFFYKLFDSDKQNSQIYNFMDVWEFDVHSTLLNTTSITVQVNFSNKQAKGYVTSVALVTAKLLPSDTK
ncbi:beta-porphyranase A-like [Haliotis rufescens]|uniref:beta-porphyranase A-like n=1 Tax=Haliotis rufescens TaxID=6454 RepID=UPI00201F48BC|nr:beta-porphyranase A-like [Haliotis rufescens]